MKFINISISPAKGVVERKIPTGGHYMYTTKKRWLGEEVMIYLILHLCVRDVTWNFIINLSLGKEGKEKQKRNILVSGG